jgi:hypothetical protein
VVKWHNNKLILKSSQEGDGYVNIFVDDGFVLFDNNIDLVNIDGNGNVVDNNGVTSWAVFNGNIVVNGLIGGSGESNITSFWHKLYIYGSLASLNTIWDENEGRLKYLNSLFGLEENTLKWLMDITKVFGWTCEDIWKWTDGVNCSNPNDKYAFNALVVIKKQLENVFTK